MNRGKPIRIQRKRSKGWRLPENTICVDRSTKWGNPFIIGKHGNREDCVLLHALLLGGFICVLNGDSEVQKKYRDFVKNNIKLLRGKNLACWCPLDMPCHADNLLEAANL